MDFHLLRSLVTYGTVENETKTVNRLERQNSDGKSGVNFFFGKMKKYTHTYMKQRLRP